MSNLSRRKFIATSATVAAASALALPASAQPVGANERIHIGLIGTGGRCRHLVPALAKVHLLQRPQWRDDRTQGRHDVRRSRPFRVDSGAALPEEQAGVANPW